MQTRVRVLLASAALLAAAAPAHAVTAPFGGSYDANEVQLKHLIGRVEISVGPKVTLSIAGPATELQTVEVMQRGSVLEVRDTAEERDIDLDRVEIKNYGTYKLTVPAGTKISVGGLIGEAAIGDVGGDLKFSGVHIDAHIGKARSADLSIAASGTIAIGEVAGALSASIAGGGAITGQNADSARLSIAGTGDISLREIRHDLTAKIAGSGDIKADGANGAVAAAIVGSGSVTVAHGRADPLTVKITGAGDVDFGGEAVNPNIASIGSGDVRLGSYTGSMHSRGPASVTIGK